jgi:hypothetical protein
MATSRLSIKADTRCASGRRTSRRCRSAPPHARGRHVDELSQAKGLRILVLDSCRVNPLADELSRSMEYLVYDAGKSDSRRRTRAQQPIYDGLSEVHRSAGGNRRGLPSHDGGRLQRNARQAAARTVVAKAGTTSRVTLRCRSPAAGASSDHRGMGCHLSAPADAMAGKGCLKILPGCGGDLVHRFQGADLVFHLTKLFEILD